jgi:hypothetical protein
MSRLDELRSLLIRASGSGNVKLSEMLINEINTVEELTEKARLEDLYAKNDNCTPPDEPSWEQIQRLASELDESSD